MGALKHSLSLVVRLTGSLKDLLLDFLHFSKNICNDHISLLGGKKGKSMNINFFKKS